MRHRENKRTAAAARRARIRALLVLRDAVDISCARASGAVDRVVDAVDIATLKGCIPAPDHPVSIEAMNAAIAESASAGSTIRFGVLAGQVIIPEDFDAPLQIGPPKKRRGATKGLLSHFTPDPRFSDDDSLRSSLDRRESFRQAEASLRLSGLDPSGSEPYETLKAQVIAGQLSSEEAEARLLTFFRALAAADRLGEKTDGDS